MDAPTSIRRIALSTGVTLNVRHGGGRDRRADHLPPRLPRIAPHLARQLAPTWPRDHLVVAPDQRGFGASDKPEGVDAYRTEQDRRGSDRARRRARASRASPWSATIGAARSPGWRRFATPTGSRGWSSSMRRIPLIFQNSLIDDDAQRAASQYMNAFRNPAMEAGIAAMGLETFFDKSFGAHVDLAAIPDEERRAYLDDWSRAGRADGDAQLVSRQRRSWCRRRRGGERCRPGPRRPSRRSTMPTLVVWGLKDKALLPVQLDGLDALVEDLRIVTRRRRRPFRSVGAARAGDRRDPRLHRRDASLTQTTRGLTPKSLGCARCWRLCAAPCPPPRNARDPVPPPGSPPSRRSISRRWRRRRSPTPAPRIPPPPARRDDRRTSNMPMPRSISSTIW